MNGGGTPKQQRQEKESRKFELHFKFEYSNPFKYIDLFYSNQFINLSSTFRPFLFLAFVNRNTNLQVKIGKTIVTFQQWS